MMLRDNSVDCLCPDPLVLDPDTVLFHSNVNHRNLLEDSVGNSQCLDDISVAASSFYYDCILSIDSCSKKVLKQVSDPHRI